MPDKQSCIFRLGRWAHADDGAKPDSPTLGGLASAWVYAFRIILPPAQSPRPSGSGDFNDQVCALYRTYHFDSEGKKALVSHDALYSNQPIDTSTLDRHGSSGITFDDNDGEIGGMRYYYQFVALDIQLGPAGIESLSQALDDAGALSVIHRVHIDDFATGASPTFGVYNPMEILADLSATNIVQSQAFREFEGDCADPKKQSAAAKEIFAGMLIDVIGTKPTEWRQHAEIQAAQRGAADFCQSRQVERDRLYKPKAESWWHVRRWVAQFAGSLETAYHEPFRDMSVRDLTLYDAWFLSVVDCLTLSAEGVSLIASCIRKGSPLMERLFSSLYSPRVKANAILLKALSSKTTNATVELFLALVPYAAPKYAAKFRAAFVEKPRNTLIESVEDRLKDQLTIAGAAHEAVVRDLIKKKESTFDVNKERVDKKARTKFFEGVWDELPEGNQKYLAAKHKARIAPALAMETLGFIVSWATLMNDLAAAPSGKELNLGDSRSTIAKATSIYQDNKATIAFAQQMFSARKTVVAALESCEQLRMPGNRMVEEVISSAFEPVRFSKGLLPGLSQAGAKLGTLGIVGVAFSLRQPIRDVLADQDQHDTRGMVGDSVLVVGVVVGLALPGVGLAITIVGMLAVDMLKRTEIENFCRHCAFGPDYESRPRDATRVCPDATPYASWTDDSKGALAQMQSLYAVACKWDMAGGPGLEAYPYTDKAGRAVNQTRFSAILVGESIRNEELFYLTATLIVMNTAAWQQAKWDVAFWVRARGRTILFDVDPTLSNSAAAPNLDISATPEGQNARLVIGLAPALLENGFRLEEAVVTCELWRAADRSTAMPTKPRLRQRA